jgi:hypothetical protein
LRTLRDADWSFRAAEDYTHSKGVVCCCCSSVDYSVVVTEYVVRRLAQLLTDAAQQRLSGHEVDYIHATRDSTGNLSISCIGAAFERGLGETPAALTFARNIAEGVERVFPSRGRGINRDFMPPALTLSVRAGQGGRELLVSEMLDETRTHTHSEIFPLGQLLFTLVRAARLASLISPAARLASRKTANAQSVPTTFGARLAGSVFRSDAAMFLTRLGQDFRALKDRKMFLGFLLAYLGTTSAMRD